MANVKLIFSGADNSGLEDVELTCFVNTQDNIFIGIEEPSAPMVFITLDKSTAIKFAKTLRTEINKLQ